MARKSRFDIVSKPILVVEEECLCGIYSRLSVEDGDEEEQNSIGNQKKIILLLNLQKVAQKEMSSKKKI